MAEGLVLSKVGAPAAPAAGKVDIYASADTPSLLRIIDEAGNNTALNETPGFSVASQAPVAATRTYITGSKIAIPVTMLKAGSMFRWKFNMTKTAAGIAASTFDIAVGTLGTTGDTARVSFTKPAGTAVVDEAWVEITAIVRSIGAAGVMVGEFVMTHNLAATGHAVIPNVCVNTISASFNTTVANLMIGICITSGASDAITIQMIMAEALNL